MENFKGTSANYRLRILDNIRNGYYELRPYHCEKFIRITIDTSDKELLRLLEFDKEIIRSQKEENLSDIDEVFNYYGAEYSRRNLILLCRFEILESIDNNNFIKYGL